MDTSSVIARAHIPQNDAAALKPGDAATITAPGEVRVQGKVTLVSPALDPNSTTVEVWIEAANPDGRLRPGTTVNVQMVAQTLNNAVVVPASALLKTPEGETTVMIVSDDRAHQVSVETGIREGDRVQITKGLSGGETVIVSGAYGLPDNTKVKIAEPTAPRTPASPSPKKTQERTEVRSNLKSWLQRLRTSSPSDERYWFTRYSKSLIFLILVLVMAGAYLAFTIPISVFPTTDFPRVVIGVDNGVMPIDQMMVTITRPIEESVNSVPGLQQVRSITSRGSAEVDFFFDWHVDMVTTLQLVDAALSSIRSQLPATAVIQSHRLNFASFPILGYSLTSDTVPQTQLWTMATYDLKPRLNRLDGVATVVVQGGQEPEFHITPDPAKLLTASVTVTDILDAVRRTNLIDSPGLLQENHQLYLALVDGQVKDPAQLSQIVIKTTQTGIPVRIGDVASVAPGVKPVYTIVTANGKPAVLLNINRQPDSNTVAVADEVHAEVDRIRQSLPPGIHIEPFYDQSEVVTASIKSVRDAILIGMLLASIIMILFLRDWGASAVAALVIPVTVFVTFIALKILGESFNLMTLGGLAAAVGLVIDDAIVVVENVALHRAAGQGRVEAVHSALSEITAPLDRLDHYADRGVPSVDRD